MRLRQLEPSGIRGRLLLGMFRLVMGTKPDVMKTVLHRPFFFGRPFTKVFDQAMRAPSRWSVGQRELFAAFISQQNRTPFCVVNHSAYASKSMKSRLVSDVLADWRTAPVDEATRAALAFLGKLTTDPETVSAEDVEAMRRAGVDEGSIEDLVALCATLVMMNTMADTLDFAVPNERQVLRVAPIGLRRGYRV